MMGVKALSFASGGAIIGSSSVANDGSGTRWKVLKEVRCYWYHMRVIVHGGAGGSPDEPEPRQAVLDDAAESGATESDPLDAVVRAVELLESSPRFNAGTGSAVQSDGVIRTDAGVMTGAGEAGAACSMPGVEHALGAARVVLEETPHVFVSGEHARALAAEYGIETDVDLWSDRSRDRWAEQSPPEGSARDQLDWIAEHFGDTSSRRVDDHDTVGAVAVADGQVAAATSTGGRWYALAGRVGDVPQIGAGFFASDAGGASATGAGEAIARTGVARRAVDLLDAGESPETAARRSIEELGEKTGESAGVIVSDISGRVGSAYNSAAMQTSVASSGGDSP